MLHYSNIFQWIMSMVTTIHIAQAIPQPGPPQHLSVVSYVSNIGIQWEPPTETYGNIRNYIVSWTILPDSTELTNIVAGDVTMSIISVQGQIGRLFRIRVRAENDGGIGTYSLPKYTRIACGKSYDLFPGRSITITSPGFDTNERIYPGVICTWTFKTLAKYSLDIYFGVLKLVEHESRDCSDIYMDISGIGRVCDRSREGKHERTGLQSIQMTLKSGVAAGGKGFRIVVKSVVQLPGPPTHITLRTYDHAIMIKWRPPRESTLPVTAYRVRYVVARISQYSITVGPTMRQFSINTNKFEGKVVTVSLSALIGMEEGERSRIYFARAPCRRRVHLNGTNSVNITSPGYPRAYPSNIICTWYITSENNVTSLITYLDFRLEDTSFCSSDFVTFSFKDITEHECSRMFLPKTMETNAENYTVTFVTDDRNEFAGFFIQISSKVTVNTVTGTTTPITVTNVISDDGEKLMSSVSVDSTKQTLMTSPVSEIGKNLSFTKMVSSSREHRPEKTTISTTNVHRTEQIISKNDSTQITTSEPGLITMSSTYQQSNTESTSSPRELSTYSQLAISTGNITLVSTEGRVTESQNTSAHTSEKYSSEKEDEDKVGDDAVLAIVLSTSGCIILLMTSLCYFRWRQRHGKMKVYVEPRGKYRVTNVELHDILGTHQEARNNHSRPCLNISRDTTTPVFATTKLETIPECPEEFICDKDRRKKFDRKRCHSFPFCFSARRRKIHNEIQDCLQAFEFIEDKKALENALERKFRMRRNSSF